MQGADIICIEKPAFYSLLDEVLDHVTEKFSASKEPEWVDAETAMNILNVKRTKLQELRDQGKIRFSQTSKKSILYHRPSLTEYIEGGTKNTF